MRRFLRRAGIGLGALVIVGVVAASVPIGYIETTCRGDGKTVPPRHTPAVTDAGYTRAVGDSYMTYPEWYIVHAYADLAAVTRQSSESQFNYGSSVRTFWSSLCGATRTAASIGEVTRDQRITDYIIGVSFSAEMLVQGAWERSIGALTTWTRGDTKTDEDAFNQRFLDDYAAFLRQTPWYQYPFGAELSRFWHETPFHWSLRSVERRISLSLEYGLKGIYAIAIGKLAGYSPADLTIMSVVKGDHATEIGDVVRVRDLADGAILVRTPRYAAFTKILKAWSGNGTSVVEIAGNDRALATVIARKDAPLSVANTKQIFVVPLQGRPGWQRVGLDTHVTGIPEAIRAVGQQGATFEHVYDY